MKKILIIAAIIFFNSNFSFSQTVPYNVVFDITGNEPAIQQRMVGLVQEIITSRPDAKIEVVFYGQSVAIIDKNTSKVTADISKLAENKQVQFKACAVAMKKHNVDESQLVSGVQSVPDGIYEIISKQAEGYGYIKIVQ
jgi:intracellular sulfur oxidation DsrE/DsrF family protein